MMRISEVIYLFIFNWVASQAMSQIMDWVYSQLVDFLGQFFTQMNGMGAAIFDLAWIKAITDFFGNLGWALFAVGLVMAAFDCAIEAQNGKMTIRDTALNVIKGFIACGLFTTLPVALYQFSVSIQGTFSTELSQIFQSTLPSLDMNSLLTNVLNADMFKNSTIYNLVLLIMIGYCVIKIFFANIKRGGILLVQIAIGSLYMFSVPRGYMDGFISWCKQVIGLCFTAFMQVTLLIAGLLTFNTNVILGIGIMLASSEVPRIAGHFGLDTSTRGNLMGGVYAVNSVMNMTRSILSKVK